ncbi:MAG: hypothetical protein PHT07_11035 [Paludibacter sp.]|nr:hypothetical protein [Paludibacter sp.]
MRKINIESEETDLFVDPRELTKEEQLSISNYIKLDKQKRKSIKNQPKLKAITQK